jgi:fructose transport system substrate-binding protein
MPLPRTVQRVPALEQGVLRLTSASLLWQRPFPFVPHIENNVKVKVNPMLNATSRVADTGEVNAGETDKTTTLPIRSETSTGSRHWARTGLRFAFGALALVTFNGLTTPARAAEEILIGLVTKTEVNPYFVKLRQAATAEAEKHGAKLLARFGKFDGDNEGQVAAIENFISAGVKGILITPSNSTGVLGAVKKARDKGILVIGLDTATDPADAVDATLATDNFQAGVLQGQYARKALGDKAPKLAMLDGAPGGTVDVQRHNGFLKGFGIKEGDPAIVGKQNTHGALDEGRKAPTRSSKRPASRKTSS